MATKTILLPFLYKRCLSASVLHLLSIEILKDMSILYLMSCLSGCRRWQTSIAFVDATYSAFLIPIGIAFHWDSLHFSWYNAINFVAGRVL